MSVQLSKNSILLEKMFDTNRGFRVFERYGNSTKPSPFAKKTINLLKQDYSELANYSKNDGEFLKNLAIFFKNQMPKGTSHKNFASFVVEKITQNPKIKTEIDKLSKILFYQEK